MNTDPPLFHSSGTFTINSARQDALLGQYSLPEPAMAVLLLVQGAVAVASGTISIRLERTRVQLEVRRSADCRDLPLALERLSAIWGPPTRLNNGWVWTRQVKVGQLRRECQLLEQRARFCPQPLQLNGYILQPDKQFFAAPRPARWLPTGYHLAERYTRPEEGQPGLALFRPDGGNKALHRPNSDHTYWREAEKGVQRLRWWMPWKVAGQVARLKLCNGYRVSTAAWLLAQSGQPSRALGVHHGVVVYDAELHWPELPGLCLIFDASQRELDLSGLQLVSTPDLSQWLEQQRRDLRSWVSQRVERWDVSGRGHNVTSRQNRKEIGAWLSIWGVSLISGLAVYLPLPLLGLPWIVWHHTSRKQIFRNWHQRLLELGLQATAPEETRASP